MCLLSGIADRGTDQVVKFFNVFGCQVDQVGTLTVIPNLFNWIKVRRIGRQPFNADGLGVGFQVFPQCFCPMDTPSIHDEQYPSRNIAGEGAQEGDHIIGTDVFSLNAPVKSNPASMGGKGNGTDDRESIMTTLLVEYWCLPSGCPCPPHQRLEHESTLIQKDDASVFLFSVFLYVAIFRYAKPESAPHPFPCSTAAAFGNSNHKRGESSRHGLDDTLHRNDPRLPWLSVAVSTIDSHTHEPEALREVIPGVPLSVRETSGKAGRGEALPSMLLFLLSLSPPPSVSQRMVMPLPAGLLPEYPNLSPIGLPLVVFELPVLLHFLLVSCIIV